MLKIEQRINQNNGEEIIVKTNEGEFIISKEISVEDDCETLDLFIGTFDCAEVVNQTERINELIEKLKGSQKESDEFRVFTITDEDLYIYTCFLELANQIKDNQFNRFGDIISEDDTFKLFEKSSVSFIIDDVHNSVIVKFKKSKSKQQFNTFFVKKSDIEFYSYDPQNEYLDELFKKLFQYKADSKQISIFDQEYAGISRVRV